MGKYMKACRVCGKLYEGCSAARRADGVFRWQEVACSPECGAEYLRAVNAARTHAQPDREAPAEASPTPDIPYIDGWYVPDNGYGEEQ